jgi:hypothetical protein
MKLSGSWTGDDPCAESGAIPTVFSRLEGRGDATASDTAQTRNTVRAEARLEIDKKPPAPCTDSSPRFVRGGEPAGTNERRTDRIVERPFEQAGGSQCN